MDLNVDSTQPPVYLPSRWNRRTAILGVVLVGTVLVAGATLVLRLRNNQDSLDEMLLEAQAALVDGDYVEAVDAFSQVLDDDPDNVAAIEGQLEAAAHLAQAGQLDAAIIAYESVGRKKPTEARAWRGLGQIYEARGEWGRAARWYEKWMQVAPEDKNAFLALGRARFSLREYEHAAAAYDRAGLLGADPAEMAVHLGLAYYALAQYDKAIKRLQSAVDRNFSSGLADVYYALGDSHLKVHDFEQAIEFFERAQELDLEGKAKWADEAQSNLDQAYVDNAMQDVLLDLDFSNVATEEDETYAIAKTGQKVRIEGAVHLVDGPWEGSQALVVEEGTKNECKNPSFEIDKTSWGSASQGSISRTTDDAWKGVASLRCSSGGGQGFAQAVYIGGVQSFDATVDYALSASYKLESLPEGGDVRFIAYWVGGANPNAAVSKTVGKSRGGGWHRESAVMTPDFDDRTGANFYFRITGASEDGQSILIDAFQVEQDRNRVTSYLDGSFGEGYSWLDVPHGSTSVRTATLVSLDDYIYLLGGKNQLTFRTLAKMPHDPDGTWSQEINYILSAYSDSAQWIEMYYDASADKFVVYANDSGGIHSVNSDAGAFDAGDWVDLVVTIDRANERLELYIDGAVRAQDFIPTTLPTMKYWRLGSFYDGQKQGALAFAQLAVFDRVLTSYEVEALYRMVVSAGKQY